MNKLLRHIHEHSADCLVSSLIIGDDTGSTTGRMTPARVPLFAADLAILNELKNCPKMESTQLLLPSSSICH